MAYAVFLVSVATISGAMALLSIAVLLTDGAIVDQPDVSGDDRAAFALYTGISLVIIRTAFLQVRRAREGWRCRVCAGSGCKGGLGQRRKSVIAVRQVWSFSRCGRCATPGSVSNRACGIRSAMP